MPIEFINPAGRVNSALLSAEQLQKLQQLEGYKIIENDPFTSDAPAVSSKLTIHKASDEIGCQSCSA